MPLPAQVTLAGLAEICAVYEQSLYVQASVHCLQQEPPAVPLHHEQARELHLEALDMQAHVLLEGEHAPSNPVQAVTLEVVWLQSDCHKAAVSLCHTLPALLGDQDRQGLQSSKRSNVYESRVPMQVSTSLRGAAEIRGLSDAAGEH